MDDRRDEALAVVVNRLPGAFRAPDAHTFVRVYAHAEAADRWTEARFPEAATAKLAAGDWFGCWLDCARGFYADDRLDYVALLGKPESEDVVLWGKGGPLPEPFASQADRMAAATDVFVPEGDELLRVTRHIFKPREDR